MYQSNSHYSVKGLFAFGIHWILSKPDGHSWQWRLSWHESYTRLTVPSVGRFQFVRKLVIFFVGSYNCFQKKTCFFFPVIQETIKYTLLDVCNFILSRLNDAFLYRILLKKLLPFSYRRKFFFVKNIFSTTVLSIFFLLYMIFLTISRSSGFEEMGSTPGAKIRKIDVKISDGKLRIIDRKWKLLREGFLVSVKILYSLNNRGDSTFPTFNVKAIKREGEKYMIFPATSRSGIQ